MEIDVRGLLPPEPFEKIMHALQLLPPGTSLKVRIHRQPFPLYETLSATGYLWRVSEMDDGNFEIIIVRAA